MAYSYHLNKDQKSHGRNAILEDVHTKLEDIHRKRLSNSCTITRHDRQREEFSLGKPQLWAFEELKRKIGNSLILAMPNLR